jgi:hypothetical protein
MGLFGREGAELALCFGNGEYGEVIAGPELGEKGKRPPMMQTGAYPGRARGNLAEVVMRLSSRAVSERDGKPSR